MAHYYMTNDRLLLLREEEQGMLRYDWQLERWIKDNAIYCRLFSGSLEATEVAKADIDATIRNRQASRHGMSAPNQGMSVNHVANR